MMGPRTGNDLKTGKTKAEMGIFHPQKSIRTKIEKSSTHNCLFFTFQMKILTKPTHKMDQERCQNEPGGLLVHLTVRIFEKMIHAQLTQTPILSFLTISTFEIAALFTTIVITLCRAITKIFRQYNFNFYVENYLHT